MSKKGFLSILAVLFVALGAALAQMPAAQAKPLAPLEAAAVAQARASNLPVIAHGSNLVQAWWRYRYGYHRRYWHPYRHYYYHRYYRHYGWRRHYWHRRYW